MDSTKRFIKETNGAKYIVNEKGEALPCPYAAPITRITKSLSVSGQNVEFDRLPCSDACPLFEWLSSGVLVLCNKTFSNVEEWK